jgi:lysophospholipase L1-like esterase
LLCVAVGTNDYRPVNFSDRQVEEINRGAAKRALAVLNRVRIFALYRHALLRLGKRPTGVEEQWRGGAPRVSLAEFRDNLRRFVELARAGRIPLALISEESEAASLRAKLDPYWRIMADLAAQNANVTYLDVRAYLRRFAVAGPDGPTYPRAPAQAIFVDFCHLTARGNQLVAEFLAEQLQARGLL